MNGIKATLVWILITLGIISILSIVSGCTINFQTISANGPDDEERVCPTVNTRLNVPLTGE